MSDPVRLLASPEATDLEKQLLGAWDDERPTSASRDKTLAMLGVAGGAAAAGAATAGGSMAPKAVATAWLVLAKWLALGAVVVGATTAGVAIAVHRNAAAPVQAPAKVAVQKTEAPAPVTTSAPHATVELPATRPVHATHAHAAAPAASTLAQQVAALDRARTALDEGDPARARRLVDSYESEYPAGAFLQEAEVLRIESLVHEGKTSDADRAGKRFLATYPNSPHDARVRSLLGYAR